MMPFIPSWLNQYGLNQAQFRVFCYLCSRADKTGVAWPKAETIAKDCQMAKNTVWKTIKELESNARLIQRQKKSFGSSTRYRITLPIGANEIQSIGANGIPIENSPIGANENLQSVSDLRHQSAQMDSHEGNPRKAIQERKEQADELPFVSVRFAESWNEWKSYRKQLKKPLTAIGSKKQLKKLESLGENTAIHWIDNAIEKGWQGLYEPPQTKPANRPTNEPLKYQKNGFTPRPFD